MGDGDREREGVVGKGQIKNIGSARHVPQGADRRGSGNYSTLTTRLLERIRTGSRRRRTQVGTAGSRRV